MTTDYVEYSWRVGRKVGRTLYVQLGPKPADTDPLIGVMDTPELAREAVRAHNRHFANQVRKLHPKHVEQSGNVACSTCLELWPCPTIRALDGWR